MSIIFLDDNELRKQITQFHIPNALLVETASQCIEMLKKTDICHILMLDYDLDEGRIKDKKITGCGMDVANWVCKNKKEIGTIIVHSRNFFGSNDMANILRQHGYDVIQEPFFDIKWDCFF
jgi:hypothetical protein